MHRRETQPDPATLAAIVAAVEAVWPRPVAAPVDHARVEPSRWRFSARWWSGPVAGRGGRTW